MTLEVRLFFAFLFLMVINTIINVEILLIQIGGQKKKSLPPIEDPEITRCKIASMQLFAGLGKIMELMEDGRKWNKNRSAYVIKEMEKEKDRITKTEVKRDTITGSTIAS